MIKNNLIEISLATSVDRNKIYELRHEVYASELMQHPHNEAKTLTAHTSGQLVAILKIAV